MISLASLERRVEYKPEFRIVWPDGTVRTVASRGKIDYGEAGRPERFTGLSWDVTEHYQAEEELGYPRRWLHAIHCNHAAC
jgi:PAS domain-containing protein